jgi:hypothetical protein
MAVNHYWYRNSQAHIFKVVGSGRVNNSRLCPGAKRSGERVHNALHCGMLAVLDFDPVQRTAGRGASRRCPPAPSDKRGGTGQGQSRPARSRSERYRPHAAPAAVRGWPYASQAIDEEAAAHLPDAHRAFMASAALEKIPARDVRAPILISWDLAGARRHCRNTDSDFTALPPSPLNL